jgi:hypothetical protein
MPTPEKLIVGNCYFFVYIKQGNIPVIKSLIYTGKNFDRDDSSNRGDDKFFFEDADDGCFTPPAKRKKIPITMNEELLLSLDDLSDLIQYLEDIRDGRRLI